MTVDGRVVPRLATEWAWENEGRRLRVRLLEGVTFHNGQKMDASVVSQILNRAAERPGNRSLYPSINDITAIHPAGRNEIVLDLARPSAFLPEDLEIPLETGTPAQGTGAFQIVSQSASEIVLAPFAAYRGGRPTIKKVTVKPIATLRTAWTSLLRGDVDMVTDVPPDAVEFIGNDEVQVLSFERRYQFLIAFNSSRGPFKSAAVRRALNMAVDREALLARVLQKRGTTSTGPIWPRYWAYDPTVRPYSFDPMGSEALLDQAGFKRSSAPLRAGMPNVRFTFTCLVLANSSVWERLALEVQRNLYAVGVDMQFKVVPFESFDSAILSRQYDAALIDLISGPTPGRSYIFWRSAREFKGVLNIFGYDNDEAERLFNLLRGSSNEAAVRSATRRLQRVFLDDPPALFLAWNQRARAVRRDFTIPDDGGRDPMLTLWRWKPTSGRQAAALH